MALKLLANNNAKSVLAAGISASATVITVGTGAGVLFPSPVSGQSYFKLTITDAATKTISEIMHVTSVSGDVMTVIRGQEGTTPRVWSTNDIVANMMTAGTFKSCLQIDNNLSEIKEAGQESVAEARRNLGIPDISAQPGDIKYTARSTAPSGWLKANGKQFLVPYTQHCLKRLELPSALVTVRRRSIFLICVVNLFEDGMMDAELIAEEDSAQHSPQQVCLLMWGQLTVS